MFTIHPELRENAGLIAAAALGLTVGMLQGLFYSMGTLIPAWEGEFGWSRGDMSLALTVATVAMFFSGTYAGRLGDRYGAARVGALSLALYGAVMMLLAVVLQEIWQLWAGYALLAVVGVASSAIVLMRPITAAFDARRGIAMGIALTGGGIAGFWVPQFFAYIIAFDGWRTAMVAMGALSCLAAPLVWLGFRGYESRASETKVEQIGPEFAEAIRQPAFWILSSMAIAMSLGVGGLVVHFAPLFQDLGASAIRAAEIASLLGLASVTGRLGVGFLLDRFSATTVTFVTLTTAAMGAVLLFTFGLQFAPLAVVLLGLAAGAEIDLIAYLCSRLFGTRAYGMIYGWQYSVFVLGYGISPFLVGLSRDWVGNYDYALVLSAIAIASAGILAPLLKLPNRNADAITAGH